MLPSGNCMFATGRPQTSRGFPVIPAKTGHEFAHRTARLAVLDGTEGHFLDEHAWARFHDRASPRKAAALELRDNCCRFVKQKVQQRHCGTQKHEYRGDGFGHQVRRSHL